jgi:predicted transcriptional regulator
MNRTTAIKTIEKLPSDFSIDELFEKLLFVQKVEEGIKDADKGKVFSTSEAKKKLKKWLK